MKLNKKHMFLILLFSLMFCCIGLTTFEGLTGSNDTNESNVLSNRIDPNMSKGSSHDPFNTIDQNPVPNTQQSSYSDLVQSAVPASKMKSIPKNQIQEGDEDLYILKSQVVPPVCPKCPDVKKCDKTKDCPPCPSPQRCPDNPFECKMVPKYSDPTVSKHLPRPVLNSFDTFA